MPQDKLRAWQDQREIWLKHHPQPWSEKTAGEYEERFVEGLQKWLDAGYGSCALEADALRSVVENALRHFDGQRYALDEFVIMPNHVHLLVQPMAGFSLSSILHSWKSFSSNVVNKQLGRSGTFWLDENFDHAVRSLSQLNHFRRYIAENPTQAYLRSGSFALSRGAGILPAPEDSATWKPPTQTEASRQDASLTGSRQDACSTLPDKPALERFLIEHALNPMLAEVTTQRARETQTITRHLEISLNELINRQQVRLGGLSEMQERGDTSQPLAANIKQIEDRIDELNARLEHRRAELERERECMIGDIQHVARAWVLPHPERKTPHIAAMVADPEIERIAVQFAITHEEAQGRVVESVEKDNRGFDLVSRKPHPEDPKTAIDVRFIEVKGRADTGDIALTSNEYNTAKRLKKDYYLYIVLHCAPACRQAGQEPSLNIFQDPATLDWQPIVKVEHYLLRQDSIKRPVELKEDPPPYRTGGTP
jgi:REP element-mobilizing transposase RayT